MNGIAQAASLPLNDIPLPWLTWNLQHDPNGAVLLSQADDLGTLLTQIGSKLYSDVGF